ncbi:Two-pore ion channel [Diplonema papillatum]|nr:Two-pore ion channel [Diplonema papillatum]
MTDAPKLSTGSKYDSRQAFAAVRAVQRFKKVRKKRVPQVVPSGGEPKIGLAALYMQDAMECLPIRRYRDREASHKSVRIRHALYFPRWATIWLLTALTFIEEPRWCRGTQHCNEHYYYPSWQVNFLSAGQSQIVEAVCLLVLAVDWGLWLHVLGMAQFVRWQTRVLHSMVLLCCLGDLFASIFTEAASFRLSPYLRICFFMFYSPSLRRELLFLSKALPEIFRVMLLLFLFCAVYAWFAVVLFLSETPEDEQYFYSWTSAIWTLQVMLTGNNLPDAMMPSYADNRLYFFFFLFFFLIGFFFFLNLLIGVVYNGYIEAKEDEQDALVRNREQGVDAAFQCLAVEKDGPDRCISAETMKLFYAELNRNFGVRYIAVPEMDILFALLDRDGSEFISSSEFRSLPGLLNCELSRVDVVFVKQYFPSLWESRFFKFVRHVVTEVPDIGAPRFHIPYIWPRWLVSLETSVDAAFKARETEFNVRLTFWHFPRIEDIARKVETIALKHFDEKVDISAVVVLDEKASLWVSATTSAQVFDTCQVYCMSSPDSVPPAQLSCPILEDDIEAFSSDLAVSLKPMKASTTEASPLVPPYTNHAGTFSHDSSIEPEELQSKLRTDRWLHWKLVTIVPPTSTYIDLFLDFVLIINAIVVFIETLPYLTEGNTNPEDEVAWLSVVDYVFTFVYVTEVFIKVGVFGFNGYLQKSQNVFDFVVTACCFIALVITWAPNGYNEPLLLKFVVMARLLRLLRLLQFFSWFAVLSRTLVAAFNPAKRVAMLFFVLMYVFSVLGLDLFGGRINRDPSSEYYQKLLEKENVYTTTGNFELSFNDMSSAFVFLFMSLLLNGWNEYEQAFEIVTSVFCRWYFFSYWVTGFLAGLSIVVSVLLDKFTEEWNRAKKRVERRIDPQDQQPKTMSEFFDAGYTMKDWLTAAHRAEEGQDGWLEENGWGFDANAITGTRTGQTGKYLLRKHGDDLITRNNDGDLVTDEAFIRSQFKRTEKHS